jgi:Na+/proline symporter
VIIDAATDGALPANAMILIMTVLFVIYGIAGGLSAAIVTDFVQGILTILFSFMLLPIVMNAVGGLDGMKETIAPLFPEKDMFSLVAPGDIGVFFLIMISINSLLGVVVQPHNMGTCAAGKTEIEGAVGFMGGTLLKRVCTVAWCLTGLAALAYYGGQSSHPDLVYGSMAREFLPQIMPGLLGLFIAALLATVMGSCDSFMIASSGLIAENLYKPLVPGKSTRHYLKVARLSSLVVVIGGVALAYLAEGVVPLLENLWKINTMMAMAFWLGVFWRRSTVAGAWELSLPWQMLAYIVIGFGVGIVVSLFTRPVSEQKLERFYSLLRTPVEPDEEILESCTLPEGARPGPRRVFFPNSNLEIPIPGKRAVLGFLAGWLVVGSIIASVAIWIAD